MISKHLGAGLVEVIVAILLLALGIIGFCALQLNALGATQEANNNIVAMNLAKDLTERIRVNRTVLSEYKERINDKDTAEPKNCISKNGAICTVKEMAAYDSFEIKQKAQLQGMQIIMAQCGISPNDLQCIYTAWDKTIITKDNVNNCMANGVYKDDAHCIVMEAY